MACQYPYAGNLRGDLCQDKNILCQNNSFLIVKKKNKKYLHIYTKDREKESRVREGEKKIPLLPAPLPPGVTCSAKSPV